MQNLNRKRKSLEDLLNDPEAQAFVHTQGKTQHINTSATQHASTPARQHVEERVSVSVKIPKRIADALWQAMHERTLERKKKTLAPDEPYEKQGIVSQAVEHWLKEKGYLR